MVLSVSRAREDKERLFEWSSQPRSDMRETFHLRRNLRIQGIASATLYFAGAIGTSSCFFGGSAKPPRAFQPPPIHVLTASPEPQPALELPPAIAMESLLIEGLSTEPEPLRLPPYQQAPPPRQQNVRVVVPPAPNPEP